MMAKEPKRKVKRYAGKTEEEWRDWGEKFGKRMEKRGKDFGEEMGDLGERIGKRFERKSKKWEKECKDWWFFSLGFIGPLIGSIFGIICLAFGLWILKFVNLPLNSSFISGLSSFILSKMHWFFAVFLFFGYSDYFSKRYQKTFWIVSPIFNSIGIVVVVWFVTWMLNLINGFASSTVISFVSNFLYLNLTGIFFVFLVLGYAIVFIKKFITYSLGD
jgi:hypothetical protein